eukprot:CAMPEP_0184862250 /NCGR_PEP_ID=MMETSP0580-20130426/6733_1 /TAXON_ID=1118495 /ORGANISM="Dactyliosolen fragilissimus" /LENGTH=346 /DNA_ID=CAMNT_0027360017 /DNA_START=101 /DNA_END=1141 /DNA_ORIENTATION=+
MLLSLGLGLLVQRLSGAFQITKISSFCHRPGTVFYKHDAPNTNERTLFHQLAVQSQQRNEDVVLYSDDWENDEEDEHSKEEKRMNTSRWESLDPRIKSKIIQNAQEKAIRNKKKNESAADKKRRLMFLYKDSERKRKRASRVQRPLATNSPDRITLRELEVGQETEGTVISLANFGAYVDVGSECDGLLHVSQITREEFVEHPRQYLSPGEKVVVRITRVNAEEKKLQLTMLPKEVIAMDEDDDDDDEERVKLEDLFPDDELWGEIKRVTAFGSYVEIGAEVDGWLHFMDHPDFGMIPGAKPKEFMNVGDRIRCWVASVDLEKDRVKLTANRPATLPGPRREMERR